MLEGETLKSCINAPEAETAALALKACSEIIHVPQMWALILGASEQLFQTKMVI